MAITDNCAKFLFYTKTIGVSFERTLTLGRQNLAASQSDIAALIAKFGNNALKLDDVQFADDYAEPLFKLLGAQSVDSIDFSDYEGAPIVHDLNHPIPDELKNRYTAVFDGGTLEHIFNFPTAVKNCMEMLEVGGHYIGITPANNAMGHGFYQYSPELYYRVFSTENGFRTLRMFVAATDGDGRITGWYDVRDPMKVQSRIILCNQTPTSILLVAQKTADVPIFATVPQQSDYASAWAAAASIRSNVRRESENPLLFLYRRVMPKPIKRFARNVYDLFTRESAQTQELGTIDPEHFVKFDI